VGQEALGGFRNCSWDRPWGTGPGWVQELFVGQALGGFRNCSWDRPWVGSQTPISLGNVNEINGRML